MSDIWPFSGHLATASARALRAQRKYLQANAPTFEIEGFLKENPMLKGLFG